VRGEFLFHSVSKLHRHPSELNLTLDEIMEVIWAGREIDKLEDERYLAIIKGLAGRVL
jgi:hypothetical protein